MASIMARSQLFSSLSVTGMLFYPVEVTVYPEHQLVTVTGDLADAVPVKFVGFGEVELSLPVGVPCVEVYHVSEPLLGLFPFGTPLGSGKLVEALLVLVAVPLEVGLETVNYPLNLHGH